MNARATLHVTVLLAALGCEDSTGLAGLHHVEVIGPGPGAFFLVNDTAQVLLFGFARNDDPYPAGPVTWRSTNPTVASIDSRGIVIGLSLGTTWLVGSVAEVIDSLSLTVSGTAHRVPITSSETWTAAGSPHVVQRPVHVGGPGSGAILTIDAGATVQFLDTAELTFGRDGVGSLRALGTAAAPITVMSQPHGGQASLRWTGLTFYGPTMSELHYVTVSGCGRSRGPFELSGCLVTARRFLRTDPTLLIDHVTVENAAGGALVLQQHARLAAGSTALTVRSMRGYVAILPAMEAVRFPLGGTLAADTNEVRLASDTLRESATWASGIPWVVVGPVLIEGPLTPVLTIPPGLTVRFDLYGSLIAGRNAPGDLRVGTEGGATVTMRANSSTWSGVAFHSGAQHSSIANAVLENCGDFGDVPYGRACVYFVGNFYGSAPAPIIKNVTIRGAADVGVSSIGGGCFGAGSANVTITGTVGLIGSPLWFYGSSPTCVPTGTYTGNNTDAVRIYNADIVRDETWRNMGVPYLLSGGIGVGNILNPTLTLEPGVTIRFPPGGILSIGELGPGTLHAVGTPAQPITFTSQYDHPGAWMGVTIGEFADSSTLFEHVVVEKGGGDDGHVASAIRIVRDLGPIVRNTLMLRSGGCGITRLSGSPWTTDFTNATLGNSFVDNVGGSQCGP